MTEADLFTYLRQFGLVSGEMYGGNKPNQKYASVWFENEADAAKVLARVFHKFGTETFRVSVNKQDHDRQWVRRHKRQRSSNHLAQAPTEYKKSLMVLNDICLQEIFKHLPLTELCKISEVNKRFRNVANDVFQTKYSHLTIAFQYRKEFEQILRAFGKQINDLTIVNVFNYPVETISLIQQYCSNTLRHLTLKGFNLEENAKSNIIEKNSVLFKSLVTLTLNDCLLNYEAKERLYAMRLNSLKCQSTHRHDLHGDPPARLRDFQIRFCKYGFRAGDRYHRRIARHNFQTDFLRMVI